MGSVKDLEVIKKPTPDVMGSADSTFPTATQSSTGGKCPTKSKAKEQHCA